MHISQTIRISMTPSIVITFIVATVSAAVRRVVHVVLWGGSGWILSRATLSAFCDCYKQYEDSEHQGFCGFAMTYVTLMGMASKAM